jgi:hypothetical protein
MQVPPTKVTEAFSSILKNYIKYFFFKRKNIPTQHHRKRIKLRIRYLGIGRGNSLDLALIKQFHKLVLRSKVEHVEHGGEESSLVVEGVLKLGLVVGKVSAWYSFTRF